MLFRDPVEKALQELFDAELTEVIGAEPHERTETSYEPPERGSSGVVHPGRRC